MSKKGKLTAAPRAANRSAPPPPSLSDQAREDLMRDTTPATTPDSAPTPDAASPAAATATAPPSAAGSEPYACGFCGGPMIDGAIAHTADCNRASDDEEASESDAPALTMDQLLAAGDAGVAAAGAAITEALGHVDDDADPGPVPDPSPADAATAAGHVFADHMEACDVCNDDPLVLCADGQTLLHAVADAARQVPMADLPPRATDLGAVTADRYRLILALERAAVRGHGLDSDRALHMEAAAMIRALLDLAPDADLSEPYVVGPVVNDPPIGHSL